MAIIKKSELKQLSPQQISERLVELKKELMKINTQRAMGTTPENPGRTKAIRKTIAQIYTMQKNPVQEKNKEIKPQEVVEKK